MNNKKNFKLSIEGITGCGKTTVLNELKKQLVANEYKFEFIEEPVNEWQNLNGNNLLDLLYQDARKWYFAFNMYSYLTILQNHQSINKTDENKISILERSIYGGKYCFIPTMAKSDFNHPVEYEILDKWFDWIIENNPCELDVIFYLQTDPKVAFERIKKRSRPEEKNFDYNYLELVHKLHENWLIAENDENNNKYYRPKIIKVINGDDSVQNIVNQIKQVIDEQISEYNKDKKSCEMIQDNL